MRLMILMAVFLMCAAIAAADSGISVGIITPEDSMLKVGLTNNNDYDLDNARVRAFIPELSIITPAVTIDLDDDEKTTAKMHLLDDVPEGEYIVRISVKRGSHRKVVYRYVVFE